MSFSSDLDTFSKKTMSNLDDIVGLVFLSLGSSIVMKTAVGDATYWKAPPPSGYVGGRARANWQYGLTIKSGEVNDTDKSGGATILKIASAIPKKAGGKIHYLVNNVPYILLMEEGTLSKRQAPLGMVGITLKEFEAHIKKAVSKVT